MRGGKNDWMGVRWRQSKIHGPNSNESASLKSLLWGEESQWPITGSREKH
jgi:hypothetical protein